MRPRPVPDGPPASPAPGRASGESAASRTRPLRTTIAVEQLRRRVPGGIGTYATGLLQGLSSLRPLPDVTMVASPIPSGEHDPLLAYPFPLSEAGGRVAAMAHRSRLPGAASHVVTRLWDRGLSSVGSGRSAIADLVHSVSLAAPPTGSTPLTVMVHDVAWRHVPDAYPRHGLAWHEAALRRTGRIASAVVVPSRAVAGDLARASVELEPSQIEVIPEGCDHLPPADHDAARAMLGRLGVSGDFLLTVSTLEPRKNLQRLIEAYGRVRGDFPEPWPLLVVGPSGWGPDVVPTDGVVIAGRVSGAVLSALYASARVMAYVPLAEGFGLPAVEALWAGAPLVVSSTVPSIAEHDSPAVVVDALSIDAIASGLGELATDDSLRESLAAAGPVSLAGRTWVMAAQRHLDWWTEIVR
jgi:glycosyltransferase involved in cell wall biosynthesis